jgi:asparagine synthase (glutamine-hydrolysing)
VRGLGQFDVARYWSLPTSRLAASEISHDEAATELRDRLAEALRVRLRADVPVGFELSGGMDSSALLAIAASGENRLQAFTMGYPGTDADEVPYARLAAERYPGYVQLTVSEQRVEDFFQRADYIVGRMAEPFHSPVILSNQQIWKDMSLRGMRVSISGSAGDEVLAGYASIYFIPYLWTLLSSGRLRQFDRELTSLSEEPAGRFSRRYVLSTLKSLSHGLQAAGLSGLGTSRGRRRRRAVDAGLNTDLVPERRPVAGLEGLLHEQMTDWQMNYWMRAGNQSSMSLPIEVRFPFLDHRVVELGFTLPLGYLIRDGWMKWILRQATRNLLPPESTFRTTKMGFPFPLAVWLRRSKAEFFSAVRGTDVPAIDLNRFAQSYDQLSVVDPAMTWRLMSVSLWWKKCVLQETLAP